MTHATVHTSADIERMLSLGLAPITDNLQALSDLGFQPTFPQARRGGYEASIYERPGTSGKRRVRAERAFLILD